MAYQALDPVIAQIDNAASGMNLYRDMSVQDRSTLNAVPCDYNSSGSCKALVSSFTPAQFQNFDVGRVTSQTEAQQEQCMQQCIHSLQFSVPDMNEAHNICSLQCKDQVRRDFI